MINFFCSGEHAEAWVQARQSQQTTVLQGATLTLAEAVALGVELWGKLHDKPIDRPETAA